MNFTARWSLVLLITSAIAATAAPLLAPFATFPETKIERAPLSLLDSAKSRIPPLFGDHVDSQPVAFARTRPRARLVSRMPVIAPNKGVDYRLEIKTHDEAMDELLLIAPDVESRADEAP